MKFQKNDLRKSESGAHLKEKSESEALLKRKKIIFHFFIFY
jgi:hypothetical protein